MGRVGIGLPRGWGSPEGYLTQPGSEAGLPERWSIKPFGRLPGVSLQKESSYCSWPSPQELAATFSRVGHLVSLSVCLCLHFFLPLFIHLGTIHGVGNPLPFYFCTFLILHISALRFPLAAPALNTLGHHFLGMDLCFAPCTAPTRL